MNKFLVLVGVVFLVSGCDKPTETAYTPTQPSLPEQTPVAKGLAYYKAHQSEAEKTTKLCKQEARAIADRDQNCHFAFIATSEGWFKRLFSH